MKICIQKKILKGDSFRVVQLYFPLFSIVIVMLLCCFYNKNGFNVIFYHLSESY